MRHNKKRNTAFLYESLILEMTKSVIEDNITQKRKVMNILKEFFHSNSFLRHELEIYKSLYETKGVDKKTAEKIIYEAQRVYFGLNPQYVFQDQTKLIKRVNKSLGKDVFNNFLPNYKTLASISQIFNIKTPPKKKVMLENSLVEEMIVSETPSVDTSPVDNIVYNTFVKRFNEEYDNKLMEEQKDLLYKYIFSFSDDGMSLKISMNEEIERLRNILSAQSESKFQDRLEGVSKLLESFKNKKIDDSMLFKVLQIQQLCKEIK